MQQRLYRALNGVPGRGLTHLQRVIIALIFASVAIAVIATEPAIRELGGASLIRLEFALGALFLVEYIARAWSAGADPRYSGLSGRLRYLVRPLSLVDAIAVLPFLFGAAGAESLILRLLRVMKLLALTKLVRYSAALALMVDAVRSRRYELGLTVMLAVLVVLLSSAALYAIEGEAQPEAFGSIPRAAWWSVATLTTVGYGDLVPSTPLGKLLASLTAFAGIGLIAMPTGILAAAFSDALARARSRDHAQAHVDRAGDLAQASLANGTQEPA